MSGPPPFNFNTELLHLLMSPSLFLCMCVCLGVCEKGALLLAHCDVV